MKIADSTRTTRFIRLKQRRPARLRTGRLLCSITAGVIQLVRDRWPSFGEERKRSVKRFSLTECPDAFIEEEEVYLARRPANVAPGG